MKKLQIFATLVALLWLVALAVSFMGFTPKVELPTIILMTVTILAYTVYALCGPFTLAPFVGKILIAASFIALLTQLLASDLDLLSADTLIRSLTLVSGLVFERIVPHKQLKPWMFLMIATKIEAVLVGSLVSGALAGGYVPLEYWWSLVVVMLIGVPLLANGLKTPYRIATMSLSVLALALTADLIIAMGTFSALSVLALGAVVWPVLVERLLGYRVFMKNTQGRNTI